MIKFVNAKINLGLNILRKRADGYHDLSTLFYPVGLYNGTPLNPESFGDILEVSFADGDKTSCHSYDPGNDSFVFTGNVIDCPLEKNLVFKAVRTFNESLRILNETLTEAEKREIRNIRVSLDKHIPDGAGLGGGSADASFTLSALNELYNFPFSKEELIHMAATLGADCPFFIENVPAIASGIGEILHPFPVNLEGYWALIVKPDIYISTKEAFSGIIPSTPEKSISQILTLPVEQWREAGLHNDFEDHIFRLYPRLYSVRNSLYECGAIYASMSGSGSSVFGIFADHNFTRKAKENFSESCFIVKL